MSGKLYLVGTPIGNLSDISKRAAQVLSEADFIAAEDTRNSLKILNSLGIKKEMVSYHEHNKVSRGPEIISRINTGETCALVTDAGMPAISDPGEDLVRLCYSAGIEVSVIPGPCAAVSALAVSGLGTERFAFEGFLPSVKKDRISRLEDIKEEQRTLIFYEAPHRLHRTLSDMYAVFGEREISVVKELTKIHEKVFRCTLSEACGLFTDDEKGEFVIVVSGFVPENRTYTDEDIKKLLSEYIEKDESQSSAVKKVSADTGISRNAVYRIALAQ